MSQLSRYIQKQLTTILRKIQSTPPKRCASFKKIKTLINQAPLSSFQKTTISRSIHKIQAAMLQQTHLLHKPLKSCYTKNLFYENMFLEEQSLNKESRKSDFPREDEYNSLLHKLQEIRKTRLKRQDYLNDLIIKAQRMERLVYLKQENQEKYLRSKKLEATQQKKRATEQELKHELASAAKHSKVRSVYSLVQKFNNLMD